MQTIKLRNKTLQVPIIQGGMGVGVSLGNLAGHVAKCGGDRKSTRLNSSHTQKSRMPSSA